MIQQRGDRLYSFFTKDFIPTDEDNADIVKVFHPDGSVEYARRLSGRKSVGLLTKDALHFSFAAALKRIQESVDPKETMKVLTPVYEAVMQSRIDDVKEELGLDPGLNIDDPTLLHYLRNVAGERIRKVDEHTRDLIREQLEEGVAAGEKLSALEDRITSVFSDAKGERAEVIARTETIDASNASAYAAYERSGVVDKVEWLLAPDYDPAEDAHICDELEAAGPVPLGQEFADGIAWPPAHPNCRCAVAPIVHGEDGTEQRRWDGEFRQKHRTALGHEHSRLERFMTGKLKRVFQQQQGKVLRALRRESRG